MKTQKQIDHEIEAEIASGIEEAKQNNTYGIKKPNTFFCRCGFGTTTMKQLKAHTCIIHLEASK